MQELFFAVIAGVLIGALLMWFWLRRRESLSSSVAPALAYSPKDVETFLQKSGYTIKTKRPKGSIITTINGKEHLGSCETDYLVTKNNKYYAVVVKSGAGPNDVLEENLRCRLIEQAAAFAVNAVLFVDLSSQEIQEVTFRFPQEKNLDTPFQVLIGIFIVLVIIGIIWMMVQLRLL
jgi:hypothetical protein